MEAAPNPLMIVHHLPTELFSTRNEASNRVRQGNRDTIAEWCEIILQRFLLLLVCIRDEGSNSPFRRGVSDTTAERAARCGDHYSTSPSVSAMGTLRDVSVLCPDTFSCHHTASYLRLLVSSSSNFLVLIPECAGSLEPVHLVPPIPITHNSTSGYIRSPITARLAI
jgi:hypothetical protein